VIDFTAKILVKALQNITSWDILEDRVSYNRIPIKKLQSIFFHSEDGIDETALLRKLRYLKDWIDVQLQGDSWESDGKSAIYKKYLQKEKADSESIGIFDLVHCLISKLLTINRGRVVYRYKYLKTWRYLTGKIGTNLLVASIYAQKDYKEGIYRREFMETDVRHHDNQMLNEVLERGMSENHFHLRGSAPYFLLSWISLMNSVTLTKIVYLLDQINQEPRNPKIRYNDNFREEKFSILHLKAAAIRVYLYAVLTNQLIEFGEYHASIGKILDFIVETEPVTELLEKCEASGYRGTDYKAQNIVRFFEERKNFHTEIYSFMKTHCKGFYWFFWLCFPNIPISIFTDKKHTICKKNRQDLITYITGHYEPLPLSQCAWLFQGEYQGEYRKEWMRHTKKALLQMLKDPYSYNMRRSRANIQHVIDGFHAQSHHRYKDYALNGMDSSYQNFWDHEILFGERWLIYQIERQRFDRKKNSEYMDESSLYNLFFLYLVIKEAFRGELLQNNDKIGFRNFQVYQKRKDWFTTAFSEGELAEIAVKDAFRSQNLKCLELRVMPQKSGVENICMIHAYDEEIRKNSKKLEYYYVFHFGKKQDKIYSGGEFQCRHEGYRRELEKKGLAIISMRVGNPDIGSRLKGIDACSSEDGCRPEVFATIFRILKQHTVYRKDFKRKLPQLRVSYHVGEENQDVLDGLRAIDEAVYFLNLKSGDRLGHATMLGINAEEWYMRNNYQISIRQQDYLDNVVWMYHRMIHYHISNKDNLLEYLESEFQKYFNRVYEQCMDDIYNDRILRKKEEYDFQIKHYRGKASSRVDSRNIKWHTLHFNIHNYYYAWELRGDDPRLYIDGFYNPKKLLDIQWDDLKINPSLDFEKRNIAEATVLYHLYHYSDSVRKEGNKPIVVKIPYYMMCGIALLQKEMQKTIAKRGICIETNPSSNLLIGGLDGYDSHPIVSFHNRGLTCEASEINECPQINVSINTDDLGVFTTTLYNEFTLMAYALENKKHPDGSYLYKKDMVYDWIDHIRDMGNMQSFNRELMMEEEHEAVETSKGGFRKGAKFNRKDNTV